MTTVMIVSGLFFIFLLWLSSIVLPPVLATQPRKPGISCGVHIKSGGPCYDSKGSSDKKTTDVYKPDKQKEQLAEVEDPFLQQPIGEGAEHSHAGEEDLVGEMEDNIFDHQIPSL